MMSPHYVFLTGYNHTSSKVVISVKLLPWLQDPEDDSQTAFYKNKFEIVFACHIKPGDTHVMLSDYTT